MIKASGGLAKQERLEEMVASRNDATGIDPHRMHRDQIGHRPARQQSHGQDRFNCGCGGFSISIATRLNTASMAIAKRIWSHRRA
jgi:hypothetical protein